MGCKNIDIKNKKYGKLTAIKYAGKDNNNRSTWYFLCDCGNNVIKRKSRVLDGATLSCGCKRIKKDEDGNLKSLYVRYKKSHRKYLLLKEKISKKNIMLKHRHYSRERKWYWILWLAK